MIDDADADVWQMEHVFLIKFPFITDRLYLSGFIDHTFNEDLPDGTPDDPMFAEAQLGCVCSIIFTPLLNTGSMSIDAVMSTISPSVLNTRLNGEGGDHATDD